MATGQLNRSEQVSSTRRNRDRQLNRHRPVNRGTGTEKGGRLK